MLTNIIWIIIFVSSIFLYIFKCVTNEKLKQSEFDNEQKAKIVTTKNNQNDGSKKDQPTTTVIVQIKSNGLDNNVEVKTMDSIPDNDSGSAFRPRSTQEEFLSKNLMSVIPAPGDEAMVTKSLK